MTSEPQSRVSASFLHPEAPEIFEVTGDEKHLPFLPVQQRRVIFGLVLVIIILTKTFLAFASLNTTSLDF